MQQDGKKQCSRCRDYLPLASFAKCGTSPDGLQGYCRECQKITRRDWYRNKGGKQKLRAYHESDHGRTLHSEQARRSRRRSPEKIQARNAVGHAVAAGRLPPASEQTCLICRGRSEQYHHWIDYEPQHHLDVIPLCELCHKSVDATHPTGELT